MEFGESTVPKFRVTCNTCGVTETFYSEFNAKAFKAKHLGHDIVLEAPQGRTAPAPVVEETVEKPRPEIVPTKVAGNVVAKLLVDTRVSSLHTQPVFLVQALDNGGRTAFVLTFALEEARRLMEFLATGRHEERGFNVLGGNRAVHVWEPRAIEITDDARLGLVELGIGSEQGSAKSGGQVKESATSMATQEVVSEISAPAESSHLESPEPPTHVESAFVEEQEPQIPAAMTVPAPPPAELTPAHEETSPTPTRTRPPILAKPKKREKRERRAKAPEAPPVVKEKEERTEGLLLAKSWYIQEGEENMREAARLSEILKSFRWNVEPVYTLGVILDDNMSIESNKTEISGTLIRRIELEGYRLSAATVTSGKLTAWFKRIRSGSQAPPVRSLPIERDVPEGEAVEGEEHSSDRRAASEESAPTMAVGSSEIGDVEDSVGTDDEPWVDVSS